MDPMVGRLALPRNQVIMGSWMLSMSIRELKHVPGRIESPRCHWVSPLKRSPMKRSPNLDFHPLWASEAGRRDRTFCPPKIRPCPFLTEKMKHFLPVSGERILLSHRG